MFNAKVLYAASLAVVALIPSFTVAAGQAQCPYSRQHSQESQSSSGGVGSIRHTSDAGFGSDVLNSGQVVVVDFYATWCGPCKMLAPVLEGVSKGYQGKVAFYKVDVDKNPSLSEQFKISSVPSIKIFKNGKVVSEFSGFADEAALRERINSVL